MTRKLPFSRFLPNAKRSKCPFPQLCLSNQKTTQMKYHSDLFPFESKWIKLDHEKIHYIDEGQGQVILFSHAAIGSSFMYRRLVQLLSRSYRCIALDYPGFGLSSNHAAIKYSIVSQARMLRLFIEALQLDNLVVLGHDTGGPTMLKVATEAPQLFRGLILTDTIAYPTYEYKRIHRLLGVVGSWPFRWLNAQFNLLLRITLHLGVRSRQLGRNEKAVYFEMTASRSKRRRMPELLASLRKNPVFMQAVKSGIEQELRNKPALLIYGESDPVHLLGIPERICRTMPKAELFLIKGEAHFPHEGKPEEMADLVHRWMKKLKCLDQKGGDELLSMKQ